MEAGGPTFHVSRNGLVYDNMALTGGGEYIETSSILLKLDFQKNFNFSNP